MDKKIVNILLKTLRILLPAGAFGLGLVQGSYAMPVKETADSTEVLYKIQTHFMDVAVFDSGNWCPMICMVLLIATVAVAIVCAVKETENNLVLLANLGTFSMVACLGSILFLLELTAIAWCMVAMLGVMITVTAVQEMRMEDARKKGVR